MAFFGLSVGFERLAKLILTLDYMTNNNGQAPPDSTLRRFGHDLVKLFESVDDITTRQSLVLDFPRPKNDIVENIQRCLTDFANASRGRYANYMSTRETGLSSHDPVLRWWNDVGGTILSMKYYGKSIKKRMKAKAAAWSCVLDKFSVTLLTDENGNLIRDTKSMMIRSGENEIVQKYGRYHTLTIIRWLSNAFVAILQKSYESPELSVLIGLEEFLCCYQTGDQYLKTRKTWPK